MYDLAIIGLGTAGTEALKMALKYGLKVIVFEKGQIGGSHISSGWAATRALLYPIELAKEVNNNSKLGLNVFSKIDFNWQEIVNRKTELFVRFANELNEKYNDKFTLISAQAELFVNDEGVEIYANDNIYLAKNIIVATGSKIKENPILKNDGLFVLNPEQLCKKQVLPKKIAIIGGDVIGVEWAKFLSGLGLNIKIVEKDAFCLSKLDIDIQKEAEKILRKNKVEIYKNDFVKKVSNNELHLNSGTVLEVDSVLYLDDKIPMLPKVMVGGCSEEFILKTIDDIATDIDNLYIIGSANLKTKTSQEGKHQAWGAISKILFNKNYKTKNFPAIVQGNPEMVSLGIREQDIKGDKYIIKKIDIASCCTSGCDDDIFGFVKLILKDNVIKGAHVVSKHASHLICVLSILIENKINITKLEMSSFLHLPSIEVLLKAIQS